MATEVAEVHMKPGDTIKWRHQGVNYDGVVDRVNSGGHVVARIEGRLVHLSKKALKCRERYELVMSPK